MTSRSTRRRARHGSSDRSGGSSRPCATDRLEPLRIISPGYHGKESTRGVRSMVGKLLVGTGAMVATLTLVGCGTATDISGSGTYHGASLSTSTFAAAVTSATSQTRSVHVNGVVVVQGQHVTFN